MWLFFLEAIPVQRATDEEIRTISAQIWDADSNRIDGADVQYNVNGPTYVTHIVWCTKKSLSCMH